MTSCEIIKVKKAQRYFILLVFLFSLTGYLCAQNTLSVDRRKDILQSVKVNSQPNNELNVKLIESHLDIKKLTPSQKFIIQDYTDPNAIDNSIENLNKTLPVVLINPNSINNIFPNLKVDITFKGGFISNRYNDPYFRNDGFEGLIWDRGGVVTGAGFVLGGLNLHDPKAWFERKKRMRIAKNLKIITTWVYPTE